MNSNFNQWYECAGKQYFNVWQAYDTHYDDLISGKAHIQYVVDPELVESLKGMKRPNTDPHYIRSLIITQLKNLRKKYNKMRLLYSGGTDSHTILKLCIDNDIHIDETITHMVSYIRTPKLDIEYLNGIKFAKSHCPQSIGTVTIIQPQIEDLNFYFKNDWYKDTDIVRGAPFWLRGQYIHRYMPPADNDTITLTGMEKPQIKYSNGRLEWCLLDDPISEYMQTDSIYHLFCDKNNPELLVSQMYAFIDNFGKFKDGHNCVYDLSTNMRVDCIKKLGYYSTGKAYIDKALIGKKSFNSSLKNRLWIQELLQLGHNNTLDIIYESHNKIFLKYRDIPYGVEYKNGFVKSVGKFSQKIVITQDGFAT